MIIIKYILNNIGRKKKQSIFIILCISISSCMILLNYTMTNGIEKQLRKNINEILSGQYIIYNSKAININILESQIKYQNEFNINVNDLNKIQNTLSGIQFEKRIRLGSILSYHDETTYANIHAIEDNHLKRIQNMLTIFQGQMPQKENEILISQTLAKDLLCKVGDTILLLANNIHDYMTDATATVSGIFQEKGIALFLAYNAFMPYEYGKEMAQVGEEQNLEIILNTTDGSDLTKKEKTTLQTILSENEPGIQITSWQQTVPLMQAIVKVWNGGAIITQIIFILFSLIILITLTTLIINSRQQEIGTLLAIGFTWKKIKQLVITEYIITTILSVTISYVLLIVLISLIPENHIEINSEYMQSALMTDVLPLILRYTDYFYVVLLFTATSLLSVQISINKLKKQQITNLINN